MPKLKELLKNYGYYVLLFLFLIIIALINSYFVLGKNIALYLKFNILFFNIIWIILLVLLRIIIPHKIGRWITLVFQIILFILTIVNYFYHGYFNSIFSWQDLILSKEGLSFISSIISLINIKFIILTFALIIMIIITSIFCPKQEINFKSKSIVLLILFAFVVAYIIRVFYLNNIVIQNNAEATDTFNNDDYYYKEWLITTRSFAISGFYEYYFRDLYLTLFSKDNEIIAKKYVDENIGNYTNSIPVDSKYYGMFEGKNLILVMMESMDDWQVNEFSTPTILMMKKSGIDFVNHHSVDYVTGKTAQSEFIANTGIYPKFNSLGPHYAYTYNDYKYSLPNLFKDKGYSVKAFHRTYGHIYNRGNMMMSLGYQNYVDVGVLGLSSEEINMDSSFAIKGYDLFVKDKPFMDFYITYSNHLGYNLSKQECNTHYAKIKKHFPNEDNETILCGYAQAYETDLFFKILLEKLKKDKLLDDTVIIAFSDHPNKQYYSENESDKNNYTEMFIYSSNIEHEEINRLTNTINILPMINNLFKLESNYFMASYDPLTSDESYLIYSDYTMYDGKNIFNVKDKYLDSINMSKNILISDYYRNTK